MDLHLGTGGWSNDDWLGLLYPPGTKSGDYLRLYAEHYDAAELNASFYAIPGERSFEGMLRKTDGRVRFAVKAHKSLTHERPDDPAARADTVERLRLSVAPLRDAGALGPFLLQFPYSFHRTPENRRYLKDLVDRFEGERLAVELRNVAWDRPEVREAFRAMGLAWTSVDYPQVGGMPGPELVVTSDVAYVRLHGRNEEKWYGGKDASERHDYRYARDELAEWAGWIAARAGELSACWVMFLNTTKGHALFDLRTMAEELRARGLEPGADPW